MIRIINLANALSSISKTLSRRLRETSYASFRGRFTIQIGKESVALRIDGQGVRVLSEKERAKSTSTDREHRVRGGQELAQFFTGIDDPHRLLSQHRLRCSGEGRGLLCALFPAQDPRLELWNHF